MKISMKTYIIPQLSFIDIQFHAYTTQGIGITFSSWLTCLIEILYSVLCSAVVAGEGEGDEGETRIEESYPRAFKIVITI